MPAAEKTTDHARIQAWAEARGARPAKVSDTAGGGGDGVLRFAFDRDDEGLEEIGWDVFFRIFDENKLALLEQEETKGGETSRFAKFVAR